MHFAILGPVEVRGEKGSCEPAFPMSRQVLSLLLVHANRVVPVDDLVEELWEQSPPRLARKTVQTHVYHVRRALRGSGGGAWVETDPRGYRVRLERGQLDLWRFQELYDRGRTALREGRAAEASDACRAALDLWRGPAFSGNAAGPLLCAQRARLEDLRMGALELRVEAERALGRHRELLSELKGLVLDHPLNEVLAGELMRAAAASGHRQTALDAYRRLRAAMVEQLGLEPSAELRELHQGVLEDALVPERTPRSAPGAVESGRLSAGPAATVAPAELPPPPADFVGRGAELARVVEVAGQGHAGGGGSEAVRVVVVTGGVGSGKTAAVVQAAHRLRDSYPDGQLFATLHRPDGSAVPPREALTSLLLSFGHPGQWLPEGVEDLARLYRSWTSRRRMLVVLDDAYCPQQARPLLPSSAGCAVLLTSRWRLEGLPGDVTRVPLTGLPTGEAVDLLGRLAGERLIARELPEAAELARLYGGLPLALRALGERIAARADLRVTDLPVADLLRRARREEERLTLLQRPQSDFLARLSQAHLRLPEGERRLLALLCRLPDRVREAELLRAMENSGMDGGQLGHLVESLSASHFLESHESHECPEGPAYAVPDLVRLALSRSMGDRGQAADRSGPGVGPRALRFRPAWLTVPLQPSV
ncbi:DNA-binding transcriptional activator of the SARP family [Streptomyces zhaozhouensis]|uniref:DNA-binding transcriptional activator of the SARP family n=1 Tax=Streptomyces zhaozhouensis TaxID=1300267 RepID=A0A286E3V0_9ACTN|nr:AfsR/SARP family transcriptional regulator [Streptomyces zhaozhouensis]SOD65580.1 DNA-binding transcriptional activator of the SARP family [Streptomyces zhaozhouensis]